MRRVLVLMAFVFAVSVVWTGSSSAADEAKGSKAASTAKDPNYRWFNGQWWYWKAHDKNWVVWNGAKWVPSNEAQASRGAARSFSYQQQGGQGDQAVQRVFGTPLYRMPNNVENTQIIGSYGLRSAGSKALGNY